MAAGYTFLFDGLQSNDLVAKTARNNFPDGAVGWQTPCHLGTLSVSRHVNPVRVTVKNNDKDLS